MASHDPELPPPGLFDPIMDEESLACQRDPYTLPVRTAHEWTHGPNIWYPEREIMYDLASEQLQMQGYDDKQTEVAILIAQDAGNEQIGELLGARKKIISSIVWDMFADRFSYPTPAAITNHVVLTGMRQLVLHSITERAPRKAALQRRNEAWLLLDQRLKNRRKAFGFTPRESEISVMALGGLTARAIGKQTHITKDSASQHLTNLQTKANCDNRNRFIHRMYGAA